VIDDNCTISPVRRRAGIAQDLVEREVVEHLDEFRIGDANVETCPEEFVVVLRVSLIPPRLRWLWYSSW
jgi:hypothetical protein